MSLPGVGLGPAMDFVIAINPRYDLVDLSTQQYCSNWIKTGFCERKLFQFECCIHTPADFIDADRVSADQLSAWFQEKRKRI